MAVNEKNDIQSSLSHGITMVSICVDMSESHITMVPQWFTDVCTRLANIYILDQPARVG